MKREDVKKQIPGITDDQLDWLMNRYGDGIKAEQRKTADVQAQLDTANSQLKTAQDGLKAFDGVDVNQLKGEITTLQQKLTQQAAEHSFNSRLDGAIRDSKGMNVNAIRGMLDINSLKESKNQDADIKSALEKLKTDNPWAFAAESGTGSQMQVNTGTNHGNGNEAGEMSGVEAAFRALNPTITFD